MTYINVGEHLAQIPKDTVWGANSKETDSVGIWTKSSERGLPQHFCIGLSRSRLASQRSGIPQAASEAVLRPKFQPEPKPKPRSFWSSFSFNQL